jgi:hypothetical protein
MASRWWFYIEDCRLKIKGPPLSPSCWLHELEALRAGGRKAKMLECQEIGEFLSFPASQPPSFKLINKTLPIAF